MTSSKVPLSRSLDDPRSFLGDPTSFVVSLRGHRNESSPARLRLVLAAACLRGMVHLRHCMDSGRFSVKPEHIAQTPGAMRTVQMTTAQANVVNCPFNKKCPVRCSTSRRLGTCSHCLSDLILIPRSVNQNMTSSNKLP